MKKNQYVTYRSADHKWAVIGEHNQRATKITTSKSEAVKIATEIAKNNGAELRIQNRDHKFHECNSYGFDPCPPRDKNL